MVNSILNTLGIKSILEFLPSNCVARITAVNAAETQAHAWWPVRLQTSGP